MSLAPICARKLARGFKLSNFNLNFEISAVPYDMSGGFVGMNEVSANNRPIQCCEKAALAAIVHCANPRYAFFSCVRGVEYEAVDDSHFFASCIFCPDYCKLKR